MEVSNFGEVLIKVVCFVTASNPATCNYCFADAGSGDDVAACNNMQTSQKCSFNRFPNLGTTHCYTAAGVYKYLNGSTVNHSGITRGCINCTGRRVSLGSNIYKKKYNVFKDNARVVVVGDETYRKTRLLTLNLLFGTDKAAACAQITRAFNAYDNWTLLECKIECCTGNDCNNESVTINSTKIACK